mmetsp:Transcript_42942/g.118764  ORF Transcript_42942/g.118764 Transcript_42942/m.118764 type:complete len:411 (+) Transcript_42942:3-1235(+)
MAQVALPRLHDARGHAHRRSKAMTTPPPGAAPGLVATAEAVAQAVAAQSAGTPGPDWCAALCESLNRILESDGELEGDADFVQILCRFGWSAGCFQAPPNLEELSRALSCEVKSQAVPGSFEGRREFERCATQFINKVTPRTAAQTAAEFSKSDLWSVGEERAWRLHAFTALLLRSFSKTARYRPARGALFRDLSILRTQVIAVSELLLCTEGLREATDLWVLRILGCHRLWAVQRLTVCAVWHRQSADHVGLGTLPAGLMRRVLDMVFPEPPAVQTEVERALSPRALPTEIAIVFGHLLWSCPRALWEVWCPMALTVVETLLSESPGAEPPDADRVHHAGIVLLSATGRLAREPLPGMALRATSLGRNLRIVAAVVLTARQAAKTPGYVRHRVSDAVESAAALNHADAG